MTCIFPFESMMWPIIDALTPLAAVGVPVVTSGGHATAHPPEQELDVEVSVENEYSVFPLLSRMFPYMESDSTAIVGVELPAPAVDPAAVVGLAYMVVPGAVVLAEAALEGAEALEVLVEEPQAAATRAMPTATAAPVVLLMGCTFHMLRPGVPGRELMDC